MANHRPTRVASDSAESAQNDLPLDHALSLLLADETENALRWGAAVLESGPWTPSALVITARLLDQMGRRRAAIEGLNLAAQQATAEGNLPLAMAALGDLRALGADVAEALDQVAGAFCEGSERIQDAQNEPLLPQLGEFRPLSPFLTGPALASKAAQIVESARRTDAADVGREAPSRIAPLPLFSSLAKESLHDLLEAFETLTVPAGHVVIREGDEEAAAYIVARGELEVSRQSSDENGKPVVLARLASGAFFGEMAILSQLPGAASVIATRPSILLVAKREALEAVVEKHPDVAAELAAHCRRQSVANLGWASPVVVAIPARERAALVERFETRMFDAGDRLVEAGEGALGLHLIVSGEIAVVAHEGGERVVLANLTAGETVGEVELVLCRNALADAVAVRPTATLFLQRDEFFALVQDHPAILHGLYGIAVRRQTETSLALEAGSAANRDETRLREVPEAFASVVDAHPAPTLPQRPAQSRITPLARGTLHASRRSSPPAALGPAATRTRITPLPPPARTTPVPPPPSVRTAPRNTLPPPPVPMPAPGPPSSRRGTIPPPIPPSVRGKDTLPGVGISSVAPVTSNGARDSFAVMLGPRSSGRVAAVAFLAAAAAAFIVFVSMRGSRPEAPAIGRATPASAPPPQTVEEFRPEPASLVPRASESSTAAAAAPPAQPKAPALAAVRRRVVTVPSATPVAAKSPDPTPDRAAGSAVPLVPVAPSSHPSFPAAPPAAPSQALSAGEFGGRE